MSVETQSDSMLLLTLREVSELVSHSHDLDETLWNIVHHIRRRFGTDVCSLYTVDSESGDLILSATEGLRPEAVRQIRMPPTEGLVGLCTENKAPVAVEDAPRHPRYRYFPVSGEEQYPSFVGVPLIHGGLVQGVLVVQHRHPRRYSANEIRLLVGVASQLAILVANARLNQDLSQRIRKLHEEEGETPEAARSHRLEGDSASPGAGFGKALRFEAFDFSDPRLVAREPDSVDDELRRLWEAIDLGRADIDRSARCLANLLGDEFGDLMQAQRMMLEDSSVQRDLVRRIREGASVEQAVVDVCGEYLRAFRELENPVFYERIYDIKDVFRRVLAHTGEDRYLDAPDSLVIVAEEVSLLELFSCDLDRVCGIVVERGGAYSHVAILARSLRIPMVTNVDRITQRAMDGDEVFLDADQGSVWVNPPSNERNDCALRAQRADRVLNNGSAPTQPLPIRLATTVNLLPDVARSVEYDAEAIGLFRSEFLELAHRSFPTEQEQFRCYRRMLEMLGGRPLTLRTLDLRREKLFGLASDPRYRKQSWEWRRVDELPHVQELLRGQLRAALCAAEAGPLRILFPMMVTQRQFDCALRLLDEARERLREERLPHCPSPPVGLMVETPSAVTMLAEWAPKVDFLCVGSNDLLHSLLGVERGDEDGAGLRSALEPIFLRIMRRIVRQAHDVGKPVTVCGEVASHPYAALAMVAIGADWLSVPPDELPKIRRMLAGVRPPADAEALSEALGSAPDPASVERLLRDAFPQPM